ncbi:signal peptidase I [Solirubrobacter phytolaccae]|uniref:Signal peptidase I n=1 Tax=Solirubrobacter phytolaccae TaxID=1404360 RepID=A0A9X3NB40_9ACTN|nr:signal peptidase I [Solirubrobacter phytolaccae]MDA0183128.1 signal peptidase I [Solirubrobacter phytolaccae]
MSKRLITVLSILTLLGVVVIAVVVYGVTTYERFRVPSESMVPGTGVGAHVALNHRAYGGDTQPAIGDIVIFHPPDGAETNACGGGPPPAGQMCGKPTGEPSTVKFIKRVVAGPGDRVAMDGDGRVIRNGTPAREPFVAACVAGENTACEFPTEFTVPVDHYVMLGDNRGASDDSRFWGPVPEDWILGRVENCTLLIVGCSPRR